MRRIMMLLLSVVTVVGAGAAKKKTMEPKLQFDNSKGVPMTLQMPDGSNVEYMAWENLYYVTNVEDSTYQYLNVYAPIGATRQSPIFMRTYVGGYMASKAASPQAGDASGRALKEGFVVVVPGSRGRNSTITIDNGYKKNKNYKGLKKGTTVYTGRAPKALLDLKAAIRYLREFDDQMPGNTERIVFDGTSAGGAMSALVGATGNHPDYEPLLEEMGAARQRDDVFAAVCFCPITDLEHADMAYEWLYGQTDSRLSLGDDDRQVSRELASMFPDYVDGLQLRLSDGAPLTSDNYLAEIKRQIIRAAQLAKNAGADIPDSIGFTFSTSAMGAFAPPVNGGVDMKKPMGDGIAMKGDRPSGNMRKEVGEYIVDLDMPKYLNYVVSTQPLKGVPAFDSYGVNAADASGENGEFGDASGSDANFTDYSAQRNGAQLTDQIRANVRMLNPMNYVGNRQAANALHWYIRHGARDRDTAFSVSLNLATKLQMAGCDVNYLLAWNRPHSGDYALDELFGWLKTVLE